MPTEKPRVSVIVERPDLADLDRYARASGTPRASVIAELIHAVAPQLDRAASIMEAARLVPEMMLAKVADDIAYASDSMGRIEEAAQSYESVMERVEERLDAVGVRVRRRPRTPSY